MSKRIFTAPAVIDGIGTMKDNTVKLSVYVSRELPAEQMATLFSFNKSEGYMMFAEKQADLDDIDIPEYKTEFKGEKSPSQTQRAIIYCIWEQTTDKSKPFPSYYKDYMFRINERLKEKLD